jgi:hypothetical protein
MMRLGLAGRHELFPHRDWEWEISKPIPVKMAQLGGRRLGEKDCPLRREFMSLGMRLISALLGRLRSTTCPVPIRSSGSGIRS